MARGSFGAVRLATARLMPMPKPTKNVWKFSNERCFHNKRERTLQTGKVG